MHEPSDSILVERHEAKYLIPRPLAPAIREYIRPFCSPDRNATGDPPEYVITTMQLDTPNLSLHHARDREALARFKLRARYYGLDPSSPLYLEVKRKYKSVIVKSRARIPRACWRREWLLDPHHPLPNVFRSLKEEYAYLEFVRLVREIGAEPKVLLRYTRESYVSHVDEYARVTFDRRLCYQPSVSWSSWGEGGRWRSLDVDAMQNKEMPFSALILELKAMSHVPTWLVEMVRKFDLVRTGNCKYSSAIWAESLFRGTPAQPRYAELYDMA